MDMSTTVPSTFETAWVRKLTDVLPYINRYVGIFVLLFGTIGNIMNILVLSQTRIRSSSCSIIFIASSTCHLIALYSGLLSRILYTWSLDLTESISVLCKIRAFIAYTMIGCGFWLIALASADRWILSSEHVKRRQFSSVKNAKYCIVLIIILLGMFEIQQFYCFDVDLNSTPMKCLPNSLTCRFLSYLNLLIVSLISPVLMMIIFTLMTIVNIRRAQVISKIRVAMPHNCNQQQALSASNKYETKHRRTNRHLLTMVMIQVLLVVVLMFPILVVKLYSTITMHQDKTYFEQSIETFLYNVFLLLEYVACGMSFYINLFSGGIFYRTALRTCWNSICLCHFNVYR